MKVLAIDTTTAACSAAVWADGEIAGRRTDIIGRGHAEQLVPMIEAVIAKADIRLDELDGFAVTRGPGSFAGVRVGLATARGLALAAARPLFGMTSLVALAASVSPREVGERVVVAAVDARRDQVYVETFTSQARSLLPPAALAADSVPGWLESGLASGAMDQGLLLVGTGAPVLASALAGAGLSTVLASGEPYPDIVAIARYAVAQFERGASVRPVAPCYLRGPGAGPAPAALGGNG